VRELCEFAAKRGDLDHRFTPSPSAQEGIAGHKIVAGRRGSLRRSEVAVSGEYKKLLVRGRADGFDPEAALLDEVKTYRGAFERIPANHRALHWAQAKVYGALLCAQLELPKLNISLVYFEIKTQEETVLVERCSAAELQGFFEQLCESFLSWAILELAHRARRNEALGALRFPHDDYRPGQRKLAENAFRAARLRRCLVAQAPTGIGKTVATIFPLLKACATEGLDKIFFLSAKGSGQGLATEAIDTLRGTNQGLPLRVIELVSREKSCEYPDKACHGESCPLARGFYDRLPGARQAAIAGGADVSRVGVREIARKHEVCPYYLTQELVRWADVVVADYNYMFDSTAALHLLTLANEWKVALLVDEAHNLVERARSMYTAELSQADLRAVRRTAPPALRRPLGRLARCWASISKAQSASYAVLELVPEQLTSALAEVVAAVNELLAVSPAEVDTQLLRFHFDALQFQRLAESYASAHSLCDSSLEPQGAARGATSTRLCIRNVVPATFLRPRYAAAAATVMFSATLTPHHFYADMLGLPESTAWLDVEAPFDSSQLTVHVVNSISTRFADREASIEPIARLMAAQYEQQPGNYLAFFSSFDYLERAAAAFAATYPRIPHWAQARRQLDSERAGFLGRFSVDGRGIGFAVLGGSFAEGIDLPGSRLVGAFIATLGLPQTNPINDAMRARLEVAFRSGYDYAYLFPGMRKVVQAAGRVIRSPEDKGVVYLMDDRFSRPAVRALLPEWWPRSSAEHAHSGRALRSDARRELLQPAARPAREVPAAECASTVSLASGPPEDG
jgi:DNA excision repair protein ERCC-2